MKKYKILSIVALLSLSSDSFAQVVDASPETQTICSGGSANLTAVVTPGGPGSLPTTSYAVSGIGYAPNSYTGGTFVTLTDDSQSAVLPIGFTFCFFGNSYTQFYIGSNGWIAFSPSSTTFTSVSIPSTAATVPKNCIMGPWQDWHPGIAGGPYINYQTLGVAPNRRLVVSWNNCPMFSCTATLGRFQIIIYESTNIIENHIAVKPACLAWAGGTAVQGIHNLAGTIAYTVPGRNSTAWTATNEAYRYTPNGVATYTINWYVLPSNTLVGTGSPITVTPPAGAPSTSYYASITGTSGCGAALSSTDSVVVLQTIVPSVTASNNGPVCSGSTLNLSCLPGTPGATYSWTGPAGFTSTLQNPTIPGATAANAGVYTVTPSLAGCIGAPATTTVTMAPGIIANAGLDDSVCTAASIVLGASPTGAGFTYSWDAPGIPGFSTSATPTVSPAATATYTVTVSNASGCTGTDAVMITVGSPLVASVSATPASCFAACNGTGSVSPSGSFGGYTFSWTTGSTGTVINSLCAATYTVTVTDLFGCTAQNTITVTEPTQIALTGSTTASNCNQPDGSATLVAAGGTGAYTYLWSPGGQTTVTATNLIPGLYCVTATDANGCFDSICLTVPNTPGVSATITSTSVSCNGLCDGTATVTASVGIAPYTYLWMPGGQITPGVTGLCPGTYTCTITDANGCTVTAIATITQPNVITINTIAPVTICIGQSTTLNASAIGGYASGGYAFDWMAPAFTGPSNTVAPTVTTTYTVIATDTAGCISQSPQTVVVTVNPALGVTPSANVSICPGANTTLSAIPAGGDGTYTYNWMPGGGAGSTFTVSPAATTTYTITITDGCTVLPATGTVTVTVLQVPVVIFSPNVTFGCEPTCVTFTDASTVAGGTVTNWAWDFGNGTTQSVQVPTPVCFSAGIYDITLTATSNGGCSTTSTINNMITIYPQPVAQFTFGPQPTNTVDPTITFTDLSVDATTWSWDFGDPLNFYEPNASAQTNPTHTYADSGTYCVTLTVQNAGGCSDAITNCLVIEPEYTFYIPSGFTPNGDGLNPVFAPKGQNIAEFTMRIFDRWGNMIFKSGSVNEGWDGKVQNKSQVAQQDVYVYNIDVKDNLGKKHKYIGTVTIVKQIFNYNFKCPE